MFSTAGTAVQARLVYDVGDFVFPTENPPKRLYNAGTFHILDLGEARLDRLPTGSTHRWQGQIQAAGNAGTENFSVDRVWIVNQDESAGMLSLAPEAIAGSPTTFTGRDNFTQGTANLHGLSATVGGAWDTTETNFDGVDFVVPGSASSPVAARRPTPSDTAYLGRPALLGSAVAGCGAQVRGDVQRSVDQHDAPRGDGALRRLEQLPDRAHQPVQSPSHFLGRGDHAAGGDQHRARG